MKRHVEFLSTLYLVWGAIFVLVALAGFALALGAAAIAESSGPVRFGSEMAARLTAVTIAVIAIIALVWGALHLFIGRTLAAPPAVSPADVAGAGGGKPDPVSVRHRARRYACWVLLKDEGRSLFED